jgi:uncharacterized UPF0160 family protein
MKTINSIWDVKLLAKYTGLAKKNELRIAVHSGVFHADDVFSIALMDLALDLAMNRLPRFEASINHEMGNFITLRTRDMRVLQSADILIDVGEIWDGVKYFDHHQTDVPKNVIEEIPHSAFGLLAEAIISDEKVLTELRKSVIFGIEARDNGMKVPEQYSPAGEWVGSLNPNWDDTVDPNTAFIEAAYIAKKLLYAAIKRIVSAMAAESLIDEAAKNLVNGTTLVLDKFMPWKGYVFRKYPEVLNCVFLGHSGWTVTGALDVSETDMHQKFYFPEGFTSEGMTFLHKARFMAVFDTKEHAIEAAVKAIQ